MYICINIHTFHGNKFARKNEFKMICVEEKVLARGKISNSPFQNVRLFLCTGICTYMYICYTAYVPVLWEGGEII